MSQALANLDPHDRAFFEAQLARFGLQGAVHARGGLQVPEQATYTVTAENYGGGNSFIFRTNDIDQIKAWIGTPNAVYASQNATYDQSIPTVDVDYQKPLHELSAEESQALFYAARAYIWGPSEQVAKYKPALERYFAPFTTNVYVYTTLDVKGTIVLTDPSATIIANTINFYAGSLLSSTGNLTVYATTINYIS